ncbi:MAG: excalibur calcium-binding domain-containing protein [Geminicoccaceae bacterium]
MGVAQRAPRMAPKVDPDRKVRELRRRFVRVTRPLERRDRLRRMGRWVIAAGLPLLVVGMITVEVLTSPWPLGLTLRHIAAGVGCPMARAVNLAPAWHGDPGWWPRLDADGDGWSCEPLPRRLTRSAHKLRSGG